MVDLDAYHGLWSWFGVGLGSLFVVCGAGGVGGLLGLLERECHIMMLGYLCGLQGLLIKVCTAMSPLIGDL